MPAAPAGSIWLTVAESDTNPVVIEKLLRGASSDTVRSRSLSGKPARLLRTPWTDAWEADDSPGTLAMPLQYMLTAEADARIRRYVEREDSEAKELIGTPVGQIVGRMNGVRRTRDVIHDMVSEFVEVSERIAALLESAGEA